MSTTPKILDKTKSFVPLTTTTTTTMTSPPSARAFVRVNPGVPTTETVTQEPQGRVVLYEPVLTFSPVYASRRLSDGNRNKNKNNRSLITDAQMHDLVASMNAMTMTTTTTTTTTTVKNENDNETQVKQEEEDVKEESKTDNMGRFEDTVFSPKQGSAVKVKRSRRLTDNNM